MNRLKVGRAVTSGGQVHRLGTSTTVGLLVLLAGVGVPVTACRPTTPQGPCQKEVDALSHAHADVIHGLTQADDARETANALRKALACAGDHQIPVVLAHARMLATELAAAGNVDGVKTVVDILDSREHAAASALQARTAQWLHNGPEMSRKRLLQRAALLGGEAGNDPKLQLRSALADEAWQGGAAVAPPRETVALINHVSNDESCISVILGHALPVGMATIKIQREGQTMTLHGDSAVLKLPPSTPKAARVRLCGAGALQSGDAVTISVDGQKVFEEALTVGPEEWARGGALSSLRGVPHSRAVCSAAKSLDARTACSVMREVKP
ncbi:MAG: hypothetical protein AB2A00_15760 [Myxococcota bacterium]